MSRAKRGLSWAALGLGAVLGLRWMQRRQRQISYAGKVVVITGGSRGLGLVMARQLALQGARLALLARDGEELARAEQDLQAVQAEVMALPCDVRDQQQVEQALGRVVRRYGQIDVLINNAGVIQVGPVEHMTLDDFEDAMAIHFWGPLYATLSAANYMRQQGNGGRIANITSIGGKVAVPHLAPYAASKFALVGLSDALRAEYAKEGILVTTVVPGLMRTGSHVNALFKGQHEREYAWFSIGDALPITSTSAQHAAERVLEAIRYGEAQVTITPQARLAVLGAHLFPGLSGEILKLVNRLLPGPEPHYGDEVRSGWESQSSASPSVWTTLADQAVAENNELAGNSPARLNVTLEE